MTAVLNGCSIEHVNGKQLHSNSIFDRVCVETKKPESRNSGKKTNLDSVHESDNGNLNTPIISDAPNLYKQNGAAVSNIPTIQIPIFLKLNRCEATFWLMANHPNAYLLLNLVALRAQRTPNSPSGLIIGEALIGDYESIGATRGQYRAALKVLIRMKYLTISETCRTRKKATTATTTVGTKVRLLNSDIWDINPETNNHRNDHRATTERPPNDHEQEREEDKNGKEYSINPVANAPSEKKPSSSRKRKKIDPEPQVERDKGIFTTDTEHKKLLEEKGSEQAVKEIYSEMAIWKSRSGIEGGNDYSTAKKWQINPSTNKRSYSRPAKPKLNHDTSPSLPSKNLSFAEEA